MTERAMNPNILAPKELIDFIVANKHEADNSGSVCGDGRFTKKQSRGLIRAFGGDVGFMMAIQGAAKEAGIKISPKELKTRFAAALAPIRGEGAKPGTHTDHHNLGPGEIGCSHVAKAITGEARHKHVGPEDVGALHDEIVTGEHDGVVLEGNHAEQAVLFVYGRKWTVNSFDGKQMYFVVDIDRSMDFIEQIVPLLRIEGLTIDAVKEQFECQMNETASVLAAGRNIFAVRFNDDSLEGDFQIAHVGVVPPPTPH
jgi:hypothetical protein